MNSKFISILLSLALVLSLSACVKSPEAVTHQPAPAENITEKSEVSADEAVAELKIISLSPPATMVLNDLGLADNIVGVDDYSLKYLTDSSIPTTDLSNPDPEALISLNPDIIFATEMSRPENENPLSVIQKSADINVVYVPVSNSIEEIKTDVVNIAKAVNLEDEGKKLVANMDNEIAEFKLISENIESKKSVYFEISGPPDMYSVGSGVFFNELLEIIGAENIFASESGWIAVSPETVISKNPDVIITTVDYIDDPVGEISARPGFSELPAVNSGNVFLLNPDSSSKTNHRVVEVLKELALLIYPDEYAEIQ